MRAHVPRLHLELEREAALLHLFEMLQRYPCLRQLRFHRMTKADRLVCIFFFGGRSLVGGLLG